MTNLIVSGGKSLNGSCRIQGSKNAALALYAAALLPEEPVELTNVPDISDMQVCAGLAECLGFEVERGGGAHRLADTSCAGHRRLPSDLAGAVRGSVSIAVAALVKRGSVSFPMPGGDAFCHRPIDRHLAVMQAAGANLAAQDGHLQAHLDGRPKGFKFSAATAWGPSLGATVSALLLAVLAEGTSLITDASPDPEVRDVVRFLRDCGAQIDCRYDGALEVTGVRRLHGATFAIPSDRHEAGTIAIAALLTGGRVVMHDVADVDLSPGLVEMLIRSGGHLSMHGGGLAVERAGPLRAGDVDAAPFPAFPTDVQPPATVLLTQACGVSVMTDHVFPQRMSHLAGLRLMGADVQVAGARMVISGATPLRGADLVAGDIRCAATFVLAALVAEGDSRISGISHLNRGYANLPAKLLALGADVRVGE